MFNLRPEQHRKILGWAIIGFGTGLVLGNLDKMLILIQGIDKTGMLWPSILSVWLIFFVSLFAGIAFKDSADAPTALGLTFVVVAIATFPLGTILGSYILVYLFVIYKEREPEIRASEHNSLDDE